LRLSEVEPQSLIAINAQRRTCLFSFRDLPTITQELFQSAKIRIPIKSDFIFVTRARLSYGKFQIVPICRQVCPAMIVCSCNVFSDHDVRATLSDREVTPRTTCQVYRCLGCSAQCGRCARTIRRIMNEALAAAEPAYGKDSR
jgi:bacterioferritin-associated ferredoxin